MGSFAKPDQPTIIEPFAILPVYCSGIGPVTICDGNVHYLFYIKQHSAEEPKRIERIANLRLIMPLSAVSVTNRIIGQALASHGADHLTTESLALTA